MFFIKYIIKNMSHIQNIILIYIYNIQNIYVQCQNLSLCRITKNEIFLKQL